MDRARLELSDYRKMAEILMKLKVKFILSITAHPKMKEVFSRFRAKTVTLNYTMGVKRQKAAEELLLLNY